MRVYCPNCHETVDAGEDSSLREIVCESCGGSISLVPEDTVTYRPAAPRTIAHFELLDEVGAGAFGSVWRARDTSLDRIVAIKIPRRGRLSPSEMEQFFREARAAAQLTHPAIVSVHEVGRAGDTVYIASEFVRGVTLAERLTGELFSPREAAELCAAIADGVEHAHQAGVIHRDLKPGNIMLDGEGRPHIMDFGLAKWEAGEATLTADGQIVGTPSYMSPEQAAGDLHKVDGRTDVYALGVILYLLLTGKRPFRGAPNYVIQQVLEEEPRPPRSLNRRAPRDLETICLKAMAKQPDRRYATAQAMADDLRRYLRGEPIQARPAGRMERTWRWCRRNPALAAMGSLAAVAVALLAVALALLRPEQPFLRTVRLDTDPSGATVVFHPLDPKTGEPQPERAVWPGLSPVEVELEPGEYLVVAVSHTPGYSFHEVYRTVPEPDAPMAEVYRHWYYKILPDESAELPTIAIPRDSVTQGMVLCEAVGEFEVRHRANMRPHRRSVPGFWLDTKAVSVADFVVESPRPIGLQLYARYAKPLRPDEPIAFVCFDEAAAYAETVGKRLPTEWEYERVAGDRRTGDLLRGSPAEWTDSWPAYDSQHWQLPFPHPSAPSDHRILHGDPQSLLEGPPAPDEDAHGPALRRVLDRRTWKPGLGFRCARSEHPRLGPRDFSRVLDELPAR